MSGHLQLQLTELKIGTLVTLVLEKVHNNLTFLDFFLLECRAHTGQLDGRARPVM